MLKTNDVPTTPAEDSSESDRYAKLLERLAVKNRVAVERHVAACEAEPSPRHARQWKRLACLLAEVICEPVGSAAQPASPSARQFGVEASGHCALRFFAPDGKYRRQVFALEDLRDQSLSIFAINGLEKAVKAGIVRGPIEKPTGDDRCATYELATEQPAVRVRIGFLNAGNIGNAPEYYRHMVGWNRTALRIVLPAESGGDELRSLAPLLALCARGASESE